MQAIGIRQDYIIACVNKISDVVMIGKLRCRHAVAIYETLLINPEILKNYFDTWKWHCLTIPWTPSERREGKKKQKIVVIMNDSKVKTNNKNPYVSRKTLAFPTNRDVIMMSKALKATHVTYRWRSNAPQMMDHFSVHRGWTMQMFPTRQILHIPCKRCSSFSWSNFLISVELLHHKPSNENDSCKKTTVTSW